MFLSSASVTGNILKPLLFEAIQHLGKSGFTANANTIDGAAWNKRAWTLFNMSKNQLGI